MKLNFKKIFIFFIIYSIIESFSLAQVNIAVKVNNNIITSHDILKEVNYLKILNPGLINLDNNRIIKLAKDTLIKEMIKKEEIIKYIDLKEVNPAVEQYFSNLLFKLGYENQEKFKEVIKDKDIYSAAEIKNKIKIEFYWNDLIFNKFSNQLEIDKDRLNKKINEIVNNEKKSVLLSEIVFKKDEKENIDNTVIKILKAIDEIGFNNTANLYSISDSSKFSGKIGWVVEDMLPQNIYDEIKKLKINQISNPIKFADNYVIFLVEDIKITKIDIDRDAELKKIIEIEKDKKLTNISKIYYDKLKNNYLINEK